jgi:hypothetical protein
LALDTEKKQLRVACTCGSRTIPYRTSPPRQASLAVGDGGTLVGKRWVLLEKRAGRERLMAQRLGWGRCRLPLVRRTGGSRQLVRRCPGLNLGPSELDLGQRMALLQGSAASYPSFGSRCRILCSSSPLRPANGVGSASLA